MACSSENQWLDTALNLAGDNRAELQKVLDRYKEEDGDKYRAACFLIENMPFHGAYEGKALENYRKYFSEYVSFPYSRHVQELIDSLKRADGEFSINQLTYKRDIMTVDSAFFGQSYRMGISKSGGSNLGESMLIFDTFLRIYIAL